MTTQSLEENSAQDSNTEKTTSVLTVEQLNRRIRQLIEGELDLVWVQAEISNFKAHTSGHFYFSLKDSKSQINAVMFRGHNSRLKFKPADGLQVIVRGRVTVYEPRGNYQIAVEMMEPVGAGALQKAYEQLKAKLKAEGLFAQERKKALPLFPRHIAIVTSPTGAAIRDMMNVLSRRNKMTPVTLVPTIVQGEGAAGQIAIAIEQALRLPNVDVIIIGRGGGSIEDLWAFNDENLARTISSSPIPIVSAVGHEIDFTIADFVADIRAPTPSAAAELVVKNATDLSHSLQQLTRLLIFSVQKKIKQEQQLLVQLSRRLIDPKRRLQDLMIRRDELWTRLQGAMSAYLRNRYLNIDLLQSRLVRPETLLQIQNARLQQLRMRMNNQIQKKIEQSLWGLRRSMSMLEALSPLRTVDRGYSLVRFEGKLVTTIEQVELNKTINVRLKNGELEAKIIRIDAKGASDGL